MQKSKIFTNIHGGKNWLKLWKKYKKYEEDDAIYCSNLAYLNEAEHGGHVKEVGSSLVQYIVPLCVSCNESKNLSFYVDEHVKSLTS